MVIAKWRLENVFDGSILELEKGSLLTVGRDPKSDLITESSLISKHHATISVLANGQLSITDHKSTNGTFINDKKITELEATTLEEGDIFMFAIPPSAIETENFIGPPFAYKVVRIHKLPPISIKAEASSTENTIKEYPTERLITTIKKEEYLFSFAGDDLREQVKQPSISIKDEASSAKITIKEDPTEKLITTIKKEEYSFSFAGDEDSRFANDLREQVKQPSISIKDEASSTENTIKEDPTERLITTIKKEEYSFSFAGDEDSCVVISNVEDNEFSCSPIPQISKEVEENPTIIIDDDFDPYHEIKNELYDLDYCTIVNLEPIDLTDEKDCFAGSAELLDILGLSDEKEEEEEETRVTSENVRHYAIPPIVEPHTIQMKTTSKRQASGGKVIEKRMRISSKSKEDRTKLDETEIKELRRKKLKELAGTSKRLSTIVEETNRIPFQNLDNEEEPTSTKIPKVTFATITGKILQSTGESITDKNKSRHKRQGTKKIQDDTITCNAKCTAWLGLDGDSSSRSKLPPDPKTDEEMEKLIREINQFRNPRCSSKYKLTHELHVNDELHHILCWNVGWLLEQKESDRSAPFNFDTPYFKIPATFYNFKHYVDVMSLLLRLELWEYVFHTTFENEENRTPLTVRVEHERGHGSIMYLDCEYNPESDSRFVPFRIEDFCSLEMEVKDSRNVYQYTCFGYIESVITDRQHPGTKLTVMINNVQNEYKSLHGKQIEIRICANIAGNTRLMKTLKYLEYSPLCKYVLDPSKLIGGMLMNREDYTTTEHDSPLHIKLNPLQIEITCQASEMAMGRSPGFYLIKGPPGTGKTTVIVSIVLEILYRSKVAGIQPLLLLTAPSNAAIDGLFLKLYRARCQLPGTDKDLFKIVRIGPDTSDNDLVNKFTLKYHVNKRIVIEKKLYDHPDYKKVVDRQLSQEQFLKDTLCNQYPYEYRTYEDRVLFEANVICTTLDSCVSYSLSDLHRRINMKFTCAIIDEAAQCNEIECLAPIQLNLDKIILVGDPQQLPAVICNEYADQLGFGKSLFSRIAEIVPKNLSSNNYPINILCNQYRMKPEICVYPNRAFYDGRLRSFPKFANPIDPSIKPYLLFNLTKTDHGSSSDYVNSDEAERDDKARSD